MQKKEVVIVTILLTFTAIADNLDCIDTPNRPYPLALIQILSVIDFKELQIAVFLSCKSA